MGKHIKVTCQACGKGEIRSDKLREHQKSCLKRKNKLINQSSNDEVIRNHKKVNCTCGKTGIHNSNFRKHFESCQRRKARIVDNPSTNTKCPVC